MRVFVQHRYRRFDPCVSRLRNSSGVCERSTTDHNLTHIQVVSCVFANTGTQANLVLTYTQDLQNIEIRNCSFIGAMEVGDAVFTINSPALTTELIVGVSKNITTNDGSVMVFSPSRSLKLTNSSISWSDSIAGAIVYINLFPNVYVSNTTYFATASPLLPMFSRLRLPFFHRQFRYIHKHSACPHPVICKSGQPVCLRQLLLYYLQQCH